jgi:hypothetical protein
MKTGHIFAAGPSLADLDAYDNTASVIISLFQTMSSPDQAALSRRLATGRAVVQAIPGAFECNRTSK